MNWTRLIIVAVALCLCVVQANRVVLERSYNSAYVPDGFQVVGEPNPETIIDLHFAIKQQNKDSLQDYLTQVSDPRLPTYGHYLTWEQVGNLIAPSPVSIRLLRNWLEHHRISFHFAGTGDWIVAETTVAQAEQMLQTKFSLIATTTNKNVIRALQPYSVPAEIAPHLDFIGGVHGFVGLVAQTITTKNSRANPDVNPAVVKQYTNSTGVVGLASNNSQAVAQFLEQYYTPGDLTMFQQEFDLAQNAVTKVDGPNDPSQPGVEASLDIEYIMAAGEDIVTWFVSTAGRHQGQEPFLTWIEDMEAEPDAPWVHSVSYGDKETTISADYANRCETEFQKFGNTGRTIFFASGDDGVGCKTSSCSGGQTPTLVPNWPASSPSVTAVGGIILLSDGALEGDKISSGGFSNLFGTPSYQTTVVSNYLNTATLPAVNFNTSGRGIPDVSAFSENVQIVVEGRNTKVGGTSCASPITAGIFALLNDVRIQNGLPTLGFLNPWLYYVAQTYSDAFTDVIGGQNTHSCCTGFTAVAGWDPITGWGLANYATLSNYVLTVTSY